MLRRAHYFLCAGTTCACWLCMRILTMHAHVDYRFWYSRIRSYSPIMPSCLHMPTYKRCTCMHAYTYDMELHTLMLTYIPMVCADTQEGCESSRGQWPAPEWYMHLMHSCDCPIYKTTSKLLKVNVERVPSGECVCLCICEKAFLLVWNCFKPNQDSRGVCSSSCVHDCACVSVNNALISMRMHTCCMCLHSR